jgi:signal transduction histidine kinase
MQKALEPYFSLPRRRYFSALELHAVAIGTVGAIVCFIGYGFNFDPVKTVIPGFPSMRLRTAVAFMLLSLSCILSLRGARNASILSSVIAAGTIIWVMQAVMNDWGVEEDGESFLVPIQATLVSTILAAASMLIVNLAPSWRLVAGVVALVAMTPALYRIVSLLLFWGAPPVNDSLLASMGIHTAILIVWFMGVCVLLHPKLEFGNVLLQASLRGRLLRSSLPLIVVVPVIAAVTALLLSQAFGWSPDGLFALSATVSVTLAVAVIWRLSSIVGDWQGEANTQAARLSRANEALEQYASSAAHDLKAPARHVLLYSELLSEALEKGDIAAGRRYVRAIRESALEMPKIIDGMLSFSRSAYTRITLTDTPLTELVQAAATQNSEDLRAAGGVVRVLAEAKLRCDSALMTTVFQNLITNAIKNRRKDRALDVAVDCTHETGIWTVTVQDNGVGFDPDFAVVAFNPLARGVHTTADGSGIGLATCRNIVQSHGGEIRVDPAYRDGARITFTLPDPAAKADAAD